MRNSLYILTIFICLSGCVALYSTHEYIIVAKETESNKPAANFPVIIHYHYDHYNVFFFKFWNAPKSTEATTDSKGQVQLKIAWFGRPFLIVGSTEFSLQKDIILNGGKPFKHKYKSTEKDYLSHRKLHENFKLPEQLYPEVDIEIKATST